MCGIAGKLNLDGQTPVDPGLIQRMTEVIAHRGPDGQGSHISGPVGLGHRRLAIIDLKPTGRQPMCNEDGSVWIVFNGEIYNYPELRQWLVARGHIFRSTSDTEVIIHLYEEEGVECLKKLRGMFAFAIWDERQKALFVARDRVGIKPVYYLNTGRALSFASEVKALLVDPEIKAKVNLRVVDNFLTYLYSPGEETIFAGVRKLPPGHYLWVKHGHITQNKYWELQFARSEKWRSLDEAAGALNDLMRRRVKDHMISDVPVGFLASGGVDSTALLSYAVEETDKDVQTFTVGFAGEGFVDERPFARLASQRFGTIHHEITMSAEDFRNFLPRYVWHMEEPVCEPPGIALYYVSKLAREHVTVLLSGEGGDEAFGGYPEYRNFQILERIKAWVGPFRGVAGSALSAVGRFEKLRRLGRYGPMMKVTPADYYWSRVGSPFQLFNPMKRELYTKEFAEAVNGHSSRLAQELFASQKDQPFLNQMLFVDTKTWLPDDLLIKADKITMATSLELRVPFLDHEVLEFAATLPAEYKVSGLATKRVLKRAFTGRVPEEILTRKKTGFPVPFGRWLNGELKEQVSDTLLSRRSTDRGYFRREAVESVVRNGSAAEKFSLLALELWHRQFIDGPAVRPI